MGNITARSSLTVLLVTVAMLTVTMPAVASHNSIGPAHLHALNPDEVSDSGTLTPNIEEGGPYDLDFHENLEDDELPARDAPPDQTGLRYTQCTTFGQAGTNYDPTNPDHCYIGYFDHILEYEFPTAPLIVTECPCDLLYPVNPHPDDDYCNGREAPEEHTGPSVDGGGAVDQTLTSLERRTDDECSFGQDNSFLPGSLLVDTTLLEGGTATAGEAVGTDPGSGTYTLPLISKPFVLIFGEPHPNNPTPSEFEAGSGPFGSNPAAGGNPLHDLSGACGDRTEQCKLLEPKDIKLYDPVFDNPEQARVCGFLPQYTFSVATDTEGEIDREQGACGNTGERMDEFVGDTQYGGFGIEGAPPTWITNVPGWSWGVIFDPRFTTSEQVGPFAADYLDDEQGFREGFINYYAVNPVSPTREGDLRCMVPNIMADGVDDNVPGFTDPGVYGTYQADAIDADIFPHPLHKPMVDTRDATHDTARTIIGPIQTLADELDVGQTIDQIGDSVPVDTTPAEEAGDRAQPFESDDTPAHAQPGDQNQHPFDASIQAGLACDVAGQLQFNEQETPLDGGLRFTANVFASNSPVQQRVLKDPTVFDEEGLPAQENDTEEGYWQPDVYSFNGNAHAVVDFNQNGEFDDCPGANLAPDEDLCPWESLWDAYNGDNCQNRDTKNCGDILRDAGYDVNGTGVGLYFVLKVTGPVAVFTEPISTETSKIQDQTTILGDQDTTAQNCIVGTSIGFESKLANHVDNAADLPTAVEKLCTGADGEIHHVADAFDDQSGVQRGTYSADIEWAKLLPTPEGVRDNAGGLGSGDSLEVTGVWSVSSDVTVAGDTAGDNNINLAGGTVHTFSDSISFDTGTQ